jgi:hypothetical protein
MHLIQKVQNHAHPLIINTEVLHEISDQCRAGHVRLRKRHLRCCSTGNQPLLLDPHFQSFAIKLGAIKKFLLANEDL